ncbi:hypothetical protein G7Y79_00012g032110 [Physcia stellaris]|nr:hypothetical protein G7Y79_00012g032110 [Physcia stellaris]
MPTLEANSHKLIVDHHLCPPIGAGILNRRSYTGSIGGKDDTPPQPVEPYGTWKPLGAGGHNLSYLLRTGRLDCYKNNVHGTDDILAEKPQGPQKLIGPPQPLDPYDSRKPSSAPRRVGLGVANTGGYNVLMKSLAVGHTIGHTVYAIAQYFGTIPTA